MADWSSKNSENIEGLFFVDDQCIACDACVNEAPNFFKMNDIQGYAFVFFQPINPEEIELCNTALEICPVEAIGKKEGDA